MQYKKLTEEDFTTGHGSETNFYSSPTVQSKSGNRNGTAAEKFAYSQVANIILGKRNDEYPSSDTADIFPTANIITIYSFQRNEFKEAVHIKSFRRGGIGVDTGSLAFCEAGRVYKNYGGVNDWYLYPDIGILIYPSLVGSTTTTFCSEEIITTSHVYIHARNNEFNYSTNPSFSDIQGNLRFRELNSNPVTYITTIGLYNDNGDLLAVAKVPPTKKTFEEEVLFQVKLDF